MNTDAIESMVRDVLSRMNSLQGEALTAAPAAGGAPVAPRSATTRWRISTRSGSKPLPIKRSMT